MRYKACSSASSRGEINELLLTWGRDIGAARQALGLSRMTCADCLFLKPDTVARIENGDPRIGLGTFVMVLWALGLADMLEGPLAPVEREIRPVFLPAPIPFWLQNRLPVPINELRSDDAHDVSVSSLNIEFAAKKTLPADADNLVADQEMSTKPSPDGERCFSPGEFEVWALAMKEFEQDIFGSPEAPQTAQVRLSSAEEMCSVRSGMSSSTSSLLRTIDEWICRFFHYLRH